MWEYKIEYFFSELSDTDTSEKELNALGSSGWELVQIDRSGYAIFKRRVRVWDD